MTIIIKSVTINQEKYLKVYNKKQKYISTCEKHVELFV
jgi:hypothetical protein